MWEDATEEGPYPAVPDALAGSPVYRLEMTNILANGDFENVPEGEVPVGWQSVGATNAEVITTADFNTSDRANGVDLASLHGDQVLLLNYESPQERFFLDLSNSEGLSPTVSPGEIIAAGALALFVDFRIPVDSFPVSLNDEPNAATDTQNQLEITRGPENNATYQYPEFEDSPRNQLTVDDDSSYSSLSIGGFNSDTETRTDGIIDNLRLTRNDLNHAVFLRVPYSDPLAPDRPRIIGGGSYTVRFWVAQDTTSGSNNRFTPRYMTVSLVKPGDDGDDGNDGADGNEGDYGGAFATQEIFLEDDAVVDQWGSGWSQVEVELLGPRSFSSDPGSTSTAFELEFRLGGAGDSAKQYPGSLMIAAPELIFSP